MYVVLGGVREVIREQHRLKGRRGGRSALHDETDPREGVVTNQKCDASSRRQNSRPVVQSGKVNPHLLAELSSLARPVVGQGPLNASCENSRAPQSAYAPWI